MEFIQLVFDTIENTGRHTFQLLTKRPERALEVADQTDVAREPVDGSFS